MQEKGLGSYFKWGKDLFWIKGHDLFFRYLFGYEENKDLWKAFLKIVLPSDLKQITNFDSIKREDTSFVEFEQSRKFKHSQADIVHFLETELDGGYYVIYEHKSYIDRQYGFVFQLLRYWVNLVEKEVQKLFPVVPILFYHGTGKLGNLSFRERFLDEFKRFVPEFEILVFNLNDYTDEQILSVDNLKLKAALLAFKYAKRKPEKFLELFSTIGREFVDLLHRPDIDRFLDALFIYLLSVLDKTKISIIERTMETISTQLESKFISIRDYLIMKGKLEGRLEGRLEGFKEGKLEGRLEANKEAILKLYSKGFSVEEISNLLEFDVNFVVSVLREAGYL